MESERDLYELLGLARGATVDEVGKAYRRAARTAHPDVGGTDALFRALTTARDVLSDAERRALYDEFGHESLKADFDTEIARAHRAEAQRAAIWRQQDTSHSLRFAPSRRVIQREMDVDLGRVAGVTSLAAIGTAVAGPLGGLVGGVVGAIFTSDEQIPRPIRPR